MYLQLVLLAGRGSNFKFQISDSPFSILARWSGVRFQVSDFKFTFQVSRTRLDANRPKTHPARKLELCMVNLQCAISRARTSWFCHLCSLHRADSPFESLARLQNREPWRFQRARDRDLPSLHTSPCKFSLQALAPDSFCHLCTLQRADSPFKSLARLQNRDPWRY